MRSHTGRTRHSARVGRYGLPVLLFLLGQGDAEEIPAGGFPADRMVHAVIARGLGQIGQYEAGGEPSCEPCDANCDAIIDDLDIPAFVDGALGLGAPCSVCQGDLNGDGAVSGLDMQPFVDCMLAPPPFGACCEAPAPCFLATESSCPGAWLGPGSTCEPDPCITGALTAHRPQHGAGYAPFPKTAVSDADEESAALGPGIRINSPGDSDPNGEDDLIEVKVEVSMPGAAVALRRSNGLLEVWTSRTKSSGSEVPFVNDKTAALPIGLTETELTVWVEWAVAAQGLADLHLEPLAASTSLDMLRFHSFGSIVMALGGEDQVPSPALDPNHGTFVVGFVLYIWGGYDVHLHDEDDVGSDGAGPAYDEVVTAVQSRMVDVVAIFGYSHGGGSTYDLADRLDLNRPGIGVFEIAVTSYVDSIENDSDIDLEQELRRPPSSGLHANHYQHGTFADFWLDGGPVPTSVPPPTGLDVETTPWGAGATHFEVDDFPEVRDFILATIGTEVAR